jgi:hypothetical protein
LQASRHVEAPDFYVRLRKELLEAKAKGYLLCCEGIYNDPSIQSTSQNAARFSRFLNYYVTKGHEFFAKSKMQSLQTEKLKYPEGAVNIDASFQELGNLCDSKGLYLSRVRAFFLFTMYEGFRIAPEQHQFPWWYKMLFWNNGNWLWSWLWSSLRALIAQVRPVLIDERNQIIFEKVTKKDSSKRLFLLYGKSHIPGLLSLFQGDGWKLNETCESETVLQ